MGIRKSVLIKYDTHGLFLFPKLFFQFSFISASPCYIFIINIRVISCLALPARMLKKLGSLNRFIQI